MAIQIDWSQYTNKQKKAIAEYVRHGKKGEAYRSAYDCDTQSQITTDRATYKFFKSPKIAVVIEQIQQEAVSRAEVRFEDAVEGAVESLIQNKLREEMMVVDAQWVLQRAALLADFNIASFITVSDEGVASYDFSQATEADWYCIQEYTVDEISKGGGDKTYLVEKTKLKSYDKLRALELVGKHVQVQAFKEVGDLNVTIAPKGMNSFYNDLDSDTGETETVPEPSP